MFYTAQQCPYLRIRNRHEAEDEAEDVFGWVLLGFPSVGSVCISILSAHLKFAGLCSLMTSCCVLMFVRSSRWSFIPEHLLSAVVLL